VLSFIQRGSIFCQSFTSVLYVLGFSRAALFVAGRALENNMYSRESNINFTILSRCHVGLRVQIGLDLCRTFHLRPDDSQTRSTQQRNNATTSTRTHIGCNEMIGYFESKARKIKTDHIENDI
jgi:hypothetical protein